MITALPQEVLEIIFKYLEMPELVNCSLTCWSLYRVFSIQQYGLTRPEWHNVPYSIPNNKMAEHRLYYRNAVLIGTTLYIVILSLEHPICWKLDLNEENPKWGNDFVSVCDSYRPVKYPATLSIRDKIYIHGGVDLLTGQPTSILYEFDVSSMRLLVLMQKGTVPYPRSMHTLSALDYNRLAIYGGRCIANGIPYNTKSFAIYDLTSKIWTSYNQMPNMPYARSLHCTVQTNDKLYIYGGQHIDSEGITKVHDDECVWTYDIQLYKWQKYLSPARELNIFSFKLPIDWLSTIGWKQSPGRCSGAAMVSLSDRIVIIGGLVSDGWEKNKIDKYWEFLKIFSLSKRSWHHIRVRDLPCMQCVAFLANWNCCIKKVFVIGEDIITGEMVMGWIVG